MRIEVQSIAIYLGTQSALVRYGLTVLLVIATSFVTVYVQVISERTAFLLFFFEIIQISFWLGIYPGILAAILSLTAVNLLVVLPKPITTTDALVLNAGFCFVSAIMLVTTGFHRQLSQALWQSRQDLAFAQTVGQIGSWRLNVMRNELTWSDENHRIFGIAQGTPMSYESFLAIVHPDDRAYVDRMWQAGLRGEPYDIEHRLIVAGKVKWVREKAVLEFDKNGHLLGGFGTTQDVTERVVTGKMLQERIDRYELVLKGAQDAIWDWDVTNRRVNYSPRWKALRGYAEDEIGDDEKTWSTNIHPDDVEKVLAAVQQHFEGKTAVFCKEYRIRCKDGSWKWILDRGIAQKDDNGSVIRMAGSESDITERKLSEMALRDSEVQLKLIMDATPALISYLDLNFCYLRVNATYEKWFGIPAEHILGRKAEELIGAEAWQMVSSYLHRARNGQQVSFDQRIPYGNNPPRWVHVTYLPNIDADGVVSGIVVHAVDIEERIASEQKITQLNRRLQRQIEEMQVIFNTVPIGLSIADSADGRHIRGNSALEQMLGLPANSELSMRGTNVIGICATQDGVELSVDALPMQRAIHGELVANQIIQITRSDHRVVTALCNASPLLNELGDPRGAVGAFLDITLLKQAEHAVENSRLQLRLLVEQAPLSIAMFDTDMNYLVTSRRWVENFGRANEDLVGLNHYEVNPDLPDRWKQVHQQVLAGEFMRNDNDVWVKADGSQHWLAWSAHPWTTPTGEIGGIIISCDDVTTYRQAEQELRDSEARLALIVNQVKAGYWDWDLLNGQLFLYPEARQQLGFAGSDFPNRKEDWQIRLHPDDRAYMLKIAEDCLAGVRSNYEAEFRLLHQDGRYRWFHSRGVLLSDLNDHPYRMLGINLDISDYMQQKQLNEKRSMIEQSFRLYIAMQTASAIAHELNQPLAAISSYADVALHMLQAGHANQQKLKQLLENCSTQTQRAGEVTRQLLAQLHKQDNPSELLNINLVVRDAIALVESDAYSKSFKIDTELAADLPPVNANALQIHKVIINLLRNGLEAMQESSATGDKILVITRLAVSDASQVQVTVQDSGNGLADTATLRKIFQPFYSSKPKGLGMGLAISRSLIVAYGGKMWAENNAQHGLSVHFTLPIAV